MTTFQASDFKSLFKMDDVSDKTKEHLTKVYGNILACSAVCALGAFMNANVHLI